MKVGRTNVKAKEKEFVEKWERRGFKKYTIDGFPYLFPPLINRPRCFTYTPVDGCLYCGNETFRYYSKVSGKKYYQCEKCGGMNH